MLKPKFFSLQFRQFRDALQLIRYAGHDGAIKNAIKRVFNSPTPDQISGSCTKVGTIAYCTRLYSSAS